MKFFLSWSAWWWLLIMPAMAENWCQFRGANTNGLAMDAKLPVEWGPDKQIIWQATLPALAHVEICVAAQLAGRNQLAALGMRSKTRCR
jgi:hypothetical protein